MNDVMTFFEKENNVHITDKNDFVLVLKHAIEIR
jgi:hypothetical protein